MVTSVDVYKEIRRLRLEGITSQRAAAKRLGISRNTVKKYWEGNAVPWDRKEYSREAAVMTLDVVQFISACLDEDDRERIKKQKHTARRIYQRLVEEKNFTGNKYESELLFKVISERSERSSSIVTTNLSFSKWTELFENATMVSALVDRLTYKSHVLDMSGPSYRLRTSQAELNGESQDSDQ